MLDNNAQNVTSGQPSIPQSFDAPPLPPASNLPNTTSTTPLTPSVTPLTPSMPSAPQVPTEFPAIPTIPQVAMEPPKKKSPVAMIAVVLLILAVLAVIAYFVGKMYMGSTDETSDTLTTEELDTGYTETIEQMDGEPAPTDDPNNPLVPPEFQDQVPTADGLPVEGGEVSP